MKKLRYVTIAVAAIAMVGMFACNSTAKESATEEVTEEVIEVVEEKTEPCSDSTAVVDTTIVVVEEEVVE